MESSRSSVVQKSLDQRSSISCDTMCSSNSSCILKRRKPVNPLATPLLKKNTNVVKQRVMSAKLLKMKTLQNQLNDAHYHITELMRENQTLKTLQKRQDRALTRYEGTSADLPRILQSHEEEIRILNERNKMLRKTIKELQDQLKIKDDDILHVNEQLKKLEKLNNDKHLMERDKLNELVQDLQDKLQKADNEIILLNRKLTLEMKNGKFKLNQETNKLKQLQKELNNALSEIERLNKLVETNERVRFVRKCSNNNINERKSMSLISLDGSKAAERSTATPVTDVKLEPLEQPLNYRQTPNKELDIMKSPAETIKARLSADSTISMDSFKSRDYCEYLPHNFDRISLEENGNNSGNSDSSSGNSDDNNNDNRSRPSSTQRLQQITRQLDQVKKKVKNKDENSIEKRLGDYYTHMVESVKTCSTTINHHKEELRNVKKETVKIVKQLKDAESKELELKHSQLMSMMQSSRQQDIDLVSQLLNDELEFQKRNKQQQRDTLGLVGTDDKKKLLATLKAIDNGDSIDFDNGNNAEPRTTNSKGKLMKELFGDLQ